MAKRIASLAVNVTTREVLGGVYRGKSVSDRVLLTHAFDRTGTKTLCRRIIEDNLCDVESDDAPSCPHCLARDPRFNGRGN